MILAYAVRVGGKRPLFPGCAVMPAVCRCPVMTGGTPSTAMIVSGWPGPGQKAAQAFCTRIKAVGSFCRSNTATGRISCARRRFGWRARPRPWLIGAWWLPPCRCTGLACSNAGSIKRPSWPRPWPESWASTIAPTCWSAGTAPEALAVWGSRRAMQPSARPSCPIPGAATVWRRARFLSWMTS